MSSGSSRGSLGSLSASSRSSLNSLSFTDIYMSSQSSSDTNLQDLHRRVEKLLQGHSTCISPIYEVTGSGSAENLPQVTSQHPYLAPHLQKSVSPGSSLSSLSPPVSPYEPVPFDSLPPPSYEQHIERQHRHHPVPQAHPSRQKGQLDHNNLQARLSELSVSPNSPVMQDPMTLGGKPTCVGIRGGMVPPTHSPSPTPIPSAITHQQQPPQPQQQQYQQQLQLQQHMIHNKQVPCLPLPTTTEVADPVRRAGYNGNSGNHMDSALDTPVSNPPLSPISETSSGVCNNLSGGNTRSVSAAVSDESVAGDSGVFEASAKR